MRSCTGAVVLALMARCLGLCLRETSGCWRSTAPKQQPRLCGLPNAHGRGASRAATGLARGSDVWRPVPDDVILHSSVRTHDPMSRSPRRKAHNDPKPQGPRAWHASLLDHRVPHSRPPALPPAHIHTTPAPTLHPDTTTTASHHRLLTTDSTFTQQQLTSRHMVQTKVGNKSCKSPFTQYGLIRERL